MHVQKQESLPQRSMQRNTGNNRMGRTRDRFKKVRDIKGTFHANMGSGKDGNGMDLTEAGVKKKWKNTQKNYRKENKMAE